LDFRNSIVFKEEVEEIMFFPAKHFINDEKSMSLALTKIQKELDEQIKFFQSKPDKLIEVERIMRRTQQDIAMMREFGYCSGIENYSRHLAGKAKGEPPETLLSYFPKDEKGNPDFLLVVDESHVTLPQLHGMYAGDQARKKNLVDYGFRLPSAMDNRPLQFKEFEERVGQQIYVSATPSEYEREASEQIVEQIIRPTGLIDPEIVVKPVLPKDKFKGQVEDFIEETVKEVKKCGRVLVTTLTKKMAEDLATYLFLPVAGAPINLPKLSIGFTKRIETNSPSETT
jgi:excinuclease ABC subunit B